ncbi:MAG: hypothetical protein M3N98_03685 [Actinomycetota bacterium]|nr:hypothetical protein [Actinomycetota bacterium]
MPKPKGGNARTGPLPLHPMAISEILDAAVKLFRANAKTMVIIVATFLVPLEFGGAFLQRNINGGKGLLDVFRDPTAASSQNDPATIYGVLALTYLIGWIVVPVVCGAASRMVLASYLGREMRPRDAIVAALRRAPVLIAASLIVHLIEIIAALPVLVPLIFVMPLFVMVAPAISIEELGPIAGIGRSLRLASRRYWPVMGMVWLSAGLTYFLGQALRFVPSLIAALIGYHWGWILLASGNVLSALVTVSITVIIATLIYLDARIRQEGFDLLVTAERLAGDGRDQVGR